MKSSTSSRVARGFTLVVTNLTKLGGLVVALNEMLIRPSLRPAVLAEAAFMMAGAQFSQDAVLAALDRIMGRHHEDDPPHQP